MKIVAKNSKWKNAATAACLMGSAITVVGAGISIFTGVPAFLVVKPAMALLWMVGAGVYGYFRPQPAVARVVPKLAPRP